MSISPAGSTAPAVGAADIARVTVISPTRRIDLALPGNVTLSELLPSIVKFSGHQANTPTEAVQSWVLQRVGEDPLDPFRPVSRLELRDGDTLHLRQRSASMPEVAFDDVVDAVSTATAGRPDWQPQHSRRMALAVLTALLVGLPALLLTAQRSSLAALLTLGCSAVAGFTAILLARAAGRPQVAATLAWSAVALAGLGGWHVLTGPMALSLLVAASTVLLTAAIMAVGTQIHSYPLSAVALAALLVVMATMVAVLFPTLTVAVYSVALVLVLALTAALPGICYRLAGVAMPNLPANSDLLANDDQRVQPDIVTRAVTADRLLSTLLLASSLATVLFAGPALALGSRASLALTGAAALALLLRARAFVGLPQRFSQLAAGLLIGLATVAQTIGHLPPLLRLLVGLAVLAVAVAGLVWYASNLYAKILAPTWGRAGDVLEWIALLAMVPLLFAVLGLYDSIRGILPG